MLCIRKTALGAGSIEPQTALDMLAIKIHVGNKRGEGELKHVANAHEDLSYWSSVLPRGTSNESEEIRYWNDGWVNEIADQLRTRNTSIGNDKANREIKT